MACKKSGVQIPSAPRTQIPRICGGSSRLELERHRPRSSESPRRVRERSGSGGFQGGRGFPVAAFEEVPVDVIGGADRGVAETSGDYVGVLAGGDEQGDVGVAQVVIMPMSG